MMGAGSNYERWQLARTGESSSDEVLSGVEPERVKRALRRFADLVLRHRDAALGTAPPISAEELAALADLVARIEAIDGSRPALGSARDTHRDDGAASRTRFEDPPSSIRVSRVALEGETYEVMSYPLDEAQTPRALDSLTNAEREVALLAARGLTNAEIARARGTSLGTVVKQIDAIYKKLGLHSRRELARFLSGI
jgi:DNA-binding CsgD family transcriptional regulator